MEDLLSARPETIIQQKVEMEEFLQKVSDLCLKISGLLDEKQKTKEIEELENTVQGEYDYRSIAIDNWRDSLRDSQEVRLCKAENLKLPKDRVSKVTVDAKDIKVAIGTLNKHNKSHVKIFFEKLFAYGENSCYGYSQYKAALACLLDDELLEQYMLMKEKEFPEICHWFFNVYNRQYSAIELENKLKHFCRESNEPIRATMERFSLVAEQLDQFYPVLQRTNNTDNNKINFIFKFVNEPAKTLLEKWRLERLESGFYSPYEMVLQKANDLERQNDCIPSEVIEISNVDINAFHRNFHKKQNFRNNSNFQDDKRKAYFNKQHENRQNKINQHRDFSEIDPIKGQKPSFYKVTKHEQRGKGEIPHFQNRQDFQFQPKMSSSTHEANRHFSDKMKNSNDFQQNKSRNNTQFQRDSYNHFRNENQGRNQNYNDHRFNNFDNFKDQNRFQSNGKYSNQRDFQKNRNSNYVNRPVRKHFFCLRCGIPNTPEEKTKFGGSDHQTSNCTIYKEYNSFNCNLCLSKNILAHHFPSHCKQI